VIDDLAQVVAAADLVLNLAEDFADLVFDRVGASGALLEAVEIREELSVDEVAQVVAGERDVVVELAVLPFRRGPALPAIRLVEDEVVGFPVELRFDGFVLLECVEVLQEEEPRGLFGVIKLGRAAGLFPENVVDIAESLFKHVGFGRLRSASIRFYAARWSCCSRSGRAA
jgi:hypothetical protein